MASDPNANIKLNQVEARQGTRAPKLVYVLAASVALVVVVFAIIWATQR
jgi:flagellar biosynthesis/type III secretory pathway M-ring protein FliF/YscJ